MLSRMVLWASSALWASRASRVCLPDNVKLRRNILLLSIVLVAVIALGYLGRTHGASLLQSVGLGRDPALPKTYQSYSHRCRKQHDGQSKHTDTDAPSAPNFKTSGTPHFGDKLAVIVETRMTDNLVPLLMHFSSVLGPSWPVVLYAKKGVWRMPTGGPFQRAVEDKRIRVEYLPPGMDITNWLTTSWFWTRPWLWEQLQGVNRVLTFQTDSILCSKANVTADDFLEWDYVGAPVAPMLGRGYNGGISIRNPKKFLSIIKNNNFDKDASTGHIELMVEDQWFYTKLLELDDSKLPSPDIAKKFSVESLWYEAPLAFHQPHEWHKDEMDEIRKYCPEVEMIYR